MYKKLKSVTILCLLFCVFCLITICTACNKNDDPNTYIYPSKRVLSIYECKHEYGAVIKVNPSFTFAKTTKPNKIDIISYDAQHIGGTPCHSVYPDICRITYTKSGNYYICCIILDIESQKIGHDFGDEKFIITDITFDVDGETLVSDEKIYFTVFENDPSIYATGTGSAISDKLDFAVTGLTPLSDIVIEKVYFSSEAIELEYGIQNTERISIEEMFSQVPATLTYGEDFVFGFCAKLKEEVDEGCGYFIAEYRLKDSDQTIRSPFGFLSLLKDRTVWDNSFAKK